MIPVAAGTGRPGWCLEGRHDEVLRFQFCQYAPCDCFCHTRELEPGDAGDFDADLLLDLTFEGQA